MVGQRDVETQLEELIQQQREKVYRVAGEINPRLTRDDVLDPHAFPELVGDPRFNYEDGVLAGLLSARISLRALFRGHSRP